jgi:LysR family transcriptional regulator, regulator for bpeEF and oprC
MDKLRALQYFVTAARSGSFTRAAGQLGVTVPAVQKLVDRLEAELATKLLQRSPHGLTLTAQGERYLFEVDGLLAQLQRADQKVRPRASGQAGVVVVGAPQYLIEAIFERAFDQFLRELPDVVLEFRDLDASENVARPGIDVYLNYGWYSPPDVVRRVLAKPKFLTAASPAFWDRYGRPSHPNDLEGIPCVVLRTMTGTLMDLWDYEKDGHIVRVPVKGPASFDNALRGSMIGLVRRGYGVTRSSDYLMSEQLSSGQLEAVLCDWNCLNAPPLHIQYRREARNDAAVSAVIDWVIARFQGTTPDSLTAELPPRPDWSAFKLPRASLHIDEAR